MAETKNAPKKAPAGGEQIKAASPLKALFPIIAIAICAIVAHVAFYGFFGHYSNFEEGAEKEKAYEEWVANGMVGDQPPRANEGHPITFWGIIYKGGVVIPIGITLMLTMFTFTIERGITISRASGKGNTDVFVKKIRNLLAKGQIDEAMRLCDQQRGSVGNVIKAGLRKYKEMEENPHMDKEQKKLAIQTELEEATMLELPMLERNLPILATTASLGTLVGLIGTVIGMIKAFLALGTGGAPNAAQLSVGISEALVNTAIGITTSAFSILFYNYFTTKIDGMTYAMDEAGYSIVQTFDVRN
ncbi:MAG: MotA/TolQ/ExbB proton channel family protein [Bacteroidetes bacterium]|nr:MAG: MotA/TolQ/ExbB proton channel family protein [Bacteroidota bacterium]